MTTITPDTVFSIKEKKEFLNSFYFQYKSGLPITKIFQIIMDTTPNLRIKSFCFFTLKKLQKGHSLYESLEKYSNALGLAYTMLISAGEKSGKLEDVLLALMKNIQKEEEVKDNLISALSYPFLIICFAIAVLIFFLSFIFPIFESFGSYEDISISRLLITAIINIIIAFSLIGGFIVFLVKNEKAKKTVVNFFASLKFISKLLKEYYFQGFFTVLALAYESGVPAIESVTMANSVIKISSINLKIQKAIQLIAKGSDISTSFGFTGVFSSYAMSQIAAGEHAGELDKMFRVVADDYQNKLELSIKVISKLIEPVMLILIGIFVVCIACMGYSKYYGSLFSLF